MQRNIWILTTCGLTLIFWTEVVNALEFAVSVGNTSEYTTNSGGTAEDEIEEWIHTPNVSVGMRQETDRTLLEAGYSVYRRIHQTDNFDDETSVAGSTNLNWNVVPERFVVSANHARSETTISGSTGDNPRNRQEVQETGANATFFQPLFSGHRLVFSAGYSEDTYSESDNDGETQQYSIGYNVSLGQDRSVEVYHSEQEREFDNFPLFDTKSQTSGLGFRSQSPRGLLNVDAGYTTTDREEPFDKVDGVTGSFSYATGENAFVRWFLNGARSIDDNQQPAGQLVDDLEGGTNVREIITNSALLADTDSADVFVNTNATVGIATEIGTNQLELSVSAADLNYETDDLDRESMRTSVSLRRSLNSNMSLYWQFSYASEEYLDRDQKDDVFESDLSLEWSVTPRLSTEMGVYYLERQSNADTVEYDEWVGSITVRYGLVNRR